MRDETGELSVVPINQKVPGSIPSQGTCQGCGPGPWLGVWERQ